MTQKIGLEGLESLLNAKNAQNAGDGNGVRDNLSLLQEAFMQTPAPTDNALSAVESCLRPALAALKWDGHERHVLQALPHFDKIENIEDLRAVFARLNIVTGEKEGSLASIKTEHCPCLFSINGTDAILVAEKTAEGSLLIFDGSTGETKEVTGTGQQGMIYHLQMSKMDEYKQDIARVGWMKFAIKKFRPALLVVFAIAALTNIASLVLPLFVMHVYDMGIGTKSVDVVWGLAVGAGLVIGLDLVLRLVRTKTMAYFAARFDAIISIQTFQQLLNMPLSMTETAPIGSQVNRIKQFESIRDAFTSSLAIAIVDLPFIFLFLIAVAVVASKIVWVPLALMAVFVVMSVITLPSMRNKNMKAGSLRVQMTNLAMELISKRNEFDNINGTDMALERYKTLSEEHSKASLKAAQFNSIVRTFAASLTQIAGLSTLTFGAMFAIDGTMTIGALIASMALIWRIVTPLQQAYLSMPRIEQTIESFKQIDRLMAVKLERDPGKLPTFNRTFKGEVSVSRAMFRYPNRNEMSLKGVSLEAKAGEIVAIMGSSGSGKTTFLKSIMGLYPLQGGSILVDKIDLRSLDPAEWRGAAGYVSENAFFFYGSIAQNMKLGCPQATDEEMNEALRDLGANEQVQALNNGIETRLTGGLLKTLSASFKQRLNLARAFTRNSSIYLLDNPTNMLDERSIALLSNKIKALRGRSTFIIATNNLELVKQADKVIYLVSGTVAIEGAPQEVLAKLNKTHVPA